MTRNQSTATCINYELEVDFAASITSVWEALLQETNLWWSSDFHMVGPDSHVELDTEPGGKGLVETAPDGSFLQWYHVQAFLPEQRKIFLIGFLAPEYGGPSTSSLRLSLEPTDDGCKLMIQDSHVGDVNTQTAESMAEGWSVVFGDGLKKHVDAK
ncbi:MAG: SRPBCC domain-containing protein [Planctomycetota bacterium]